jgi:hypothetical protein
MKILLALLSSTPMMYVLGVLVGILVLLFIRKFPRFKKAAQAGYLAYLEVEKLAKQYGWKAYEKLRPFREALDLILKEQFNIAEPTPQDIAVATKAMEKAVINEKKERLREEQDTGEQNKSNI